jgi:hypothetical protein
VRWQRSASNGENRAGGVCSRRETKGEGGSFVGGFMARRWHANDAPAARHDSEDSRGALASGAADGRKWAQGAADEWALLTWREGVQWLTNGPGPIPNLIQLFPLPGYNL